MTHPRQGAWRNRAPRPWAPGGQGARPGRGNSEAVMLILLSDGAGLTARQCATVLARAGHRVAALAQVQDKVSAFRTLARVGLPQPPAVVAASAAGVEAAGAELAGTGLAGTGLAGTGLARWPLFVKVPIGTASAGVRRAGSPEE